MEVRQQRVLVFRVGHLAQLVIVLAHPRSPASRQETSAHSSSSSCQTCRVSVSSVPLPGPSRPELPEHKSVSHRLPHQGSRSLETVRDQCRCQYILNSVLPHCFWFSFVHESVTLCIFPSILPTLWTSVTRETSATHILCN